MNGKLTSASGRLERLGIAIVALHAIVLVAHSAAHLSLHIDVNLWQNAYILLVIIVLPLVSAYLLWKRARGGFLILFLSMLGALLFGAYYHFILSGPDNVSEVGHHAQRSAAQLFQVSALLLGLAEAAGVIAGAAGLLKNDHQKTLVGKQ
jgi:hypothetical protein